MGKKRNPDNVEELLRSDSDDENYSDSQPVTSTPRRSKARKSNSKKTKTSSKKPKRSRRGNRYNSEDIDDNDLEIDAHGFSPSISDYEEEPVEMGPTGRPRRQAARKLGTLKESSEDSDESMDSGSDEGEEEKETTLSHQTRTRGSEKGATSTAPRMTRSRSPRKSCIVTLKYQSQVITQGIVPADSAPAPATLPRRSTRATSAGAHNIPASQQRIPIGEKAAGKTAMKGVRGTRGSSMEPAGSMIGTRRSTRLTGEPEIIAELSTSGKHAIVHNPAVPSMIKEEEGETQTSTANDADADAEGEEDTEVAQQESATHDKHIQFEVRESQMADVDEQQAGEPQPTQPVNEDPGHEADEDDDDDDDDDDDVPTKRTRAKPRREAPSSPQAARSSVPPPSPENLVDQEPTGRRLRRRSPQRSHSRRAQSDEDEYQEDEGGASSDDSMSSHGHASSKRRSGSGSDDHDDEDDVGRSTRSRGSQRKRRHSASMDEDETQAELAQELEDIQPSPKRRRPTRRSALQNNSGNESGREVRLRSRQNKVDYRIFRPEIAAVIDDGPPSGGGSPSKRGKAPLAPAKSLFDTNGPFGGSDVPFWGRPGGIGAIDIDSDSSDDEAGRRLSLGGGGLGVGSGIGMTPSTAQPPGILPPVGQTHNVDPLQSNLGRVVKGGKNTMADADPLGVPSDITFDSVGGLDDRIQQLKEMVMLPLMYPEMFKAKGVTPPRGVLFHGPPGTGKTLMARAVASSFTGADGKKVTFFMRKGADCLSKWVGEAERQLRLLFDEAKNSQPSIIFFDEIDGLAPVRSSKQEQIHASIVSTLLALMDGMDGRGQVVVIGATNRPDAVDPALRRPGRFDREFYFPLPATEARRKIIDIHTKGWEPPLTDDFKDQLAEQTKGYGGADLRALCTEAALNAMQRTYPQIYKSNNKLKVDPSLVKVTAKDFMVSIKKMVPSSERSSSSGAAPLPDHVQPLLQRQFESIKECIKTILPEVKRLTPLEEAEYEQEEDEDNGFERERIMETFESARVYRPRLLIHGVSGLGQQYLGAAVLHYLEKVHVQSFDLATLMSDATRSTETAIVQLFTEVKRHKPSVIFIPNVDTWYDTLPETCINTFRGLLQTISPNERVMVFGISEKPLQDLDPTLVKKIFGFSRRDRFELSLPSRDDRRQYFRKVGDLVTKSPRDYPQEVRNRRKRELPLLPPASPPPPRQQTEEEKRAQALRDRQLKNHLKLRLNNLMENLKQKYRRFKKPAINHEDVAAVLNPPVPEHDPDIVTSDIPPPPVQYGIRPFYDADGVLRVEELTTGATFFNLDLDIIEDRFSNGYYSTPRQFLQDLEKIRHDARLLSDKENKRKANEMLTNAEVYLADIEMDMAFVAQCEEMYGRELKRSRERREKEERRMREREKRREIEFPPQTPNGEQSREGAIPILGAPDHRDRQNQQNQPISSSPGPRTNSNQSNGIHHHHDHSSSSSGASTVHAPTAAAYTTSKPNILAQLTQMHAGSTLGVAPIPNSSNNPLHSVLTDASTTSGKRTSDGHTNSNPFSNPSAHGNNPNNINSQLTQPSPHARDSTSTTSTNHITLISCAPTTIFDNPRWGDYGEASKGDSQIPATWPLSATSSQQSPYQPPTSQPGSQQTPIHHNNPHHPHHNQHLFPPPPPTPIAPPFTQPQTISSSSPPHPTTINSNTLPAPTPTTLPPPPRTQLLPPPPKFETDMQREHELHYRISPNRGIQMVNTLVDMTKGFTVEQLEMCMAAAMEVVWGTRAEWDRDRVAEKVVDEVEGAAEDVRELQGGGGEEDGSSYSARESV